MTHTTGIISGSTDYIQGRATVYVPSSSGRWSRDVDGEQSLTFTAISGVYDGKFDDYNETLH